MATEVHSIPAPSTLLERRSGSRLQLLSEHPTPLYNDAKPQNKGEVTRTSRASPTSPFKFTPLTPILASPVLTPANTTASPSNSATLSPTSLPSTPVQNVGAGVKHKRSTSTLSRLHISLPDDPFDVRGHARSATLPAIPIPFHNPSFLSASPPCPRLLNDIFFVDGVPIAKTPSPTDTPLAAGSPAVSPRKPSRSRSKTTRTSFMLGSDDEDDVYGRQKREAAAKVKKLERYDDLRRYHALMELLKTEARYLQDLRILANVCAIFASS